MPIKREEFKSGLAGLAKRVYEFLSTRPDEAFSSIELAEEFDVDRKDIVDILNFLYVEKKLIDRQKIVDEFYYAAKEET